MGKESKKNKKAENKKAEHKKAERRKAEHKQKKRDKQDRSSRQNDSIELPGKYQKLSADDYFVKNEEFRVWLKTSKQM